MKQNIFFVTKIKTILDQRREDKLLKSRGVAWINLIHSIEQIWLLFQILKLFHTPYCFAHEQCLFDVGMDFRISLQGSLELII